MLGINSCFISFALVPWWSIWKLHYLYCMYTSVLIHHFPCFIRTLSCCLLVIDQFSCHALAFLFAFPLLFHGGPPFCFVLSCRLFLKCSCVGDLFFKHCISKPILKPYNIKTKLIASWVKQRAREATSIKSSGKSLEAVEFGLCADAFVSADWCCGGCSFYQVLGVLSCILVMFEMQHFSCSLLSQPGM